MLWKQSLDHLSRVPAENRNIVCQIILHARGVAFWIWILLTSSADVFKVNLVFLSVEPWCSSFNGPLRKSDQAQEVLSESLHFFWQANLNGWMSLLLINVEFDYCQSVCTRNKLCAVCRRSSTWYATTCIGHIAHLPQPDLIWPRVAPKSLVGRDDMSCVLNQQIGQTVINLKGRSIQGKLATWLLKLPLWTLFPYSNGLPRRW